MLKNISSHRNIIELRKRKNPFKNNRGMAVLEMIPVIIVLIVLLRYTYGFFGVIQSATLQSIAARNYSFETFRHRSRLAYLREGDVEERTKYKKGVRLHGIRDERSVASSTPFWDVATRDITFPRRPVDPIGANSWSARKQEQNKIVAGKRFVEGDGVDSVWIAIRYGMCVDFKCRD